ncbi:tetratricopeptide repeat protein [Crenobacter sp. SG2305]|uniref:YfgM family protein n=1 Tax=Crenobacter oryzisoli TaxID=3056844 RepID=UPI0025AAB220|nr:tetratricopeptide repeat protein [Crenobacter sp. SG2305]MDN0081377.1 tetratricopeptide repeat protein [Crenobacter sp. SG2305]
MAFDLQEQEQIDELKAFWNDWGKLIAGVVLAAALGYSGFVGWEYYQRTQAEKAEALYSQLEQAAQQGDLAKLKPVQAALVADYPSTAYASRGALLAARVAFDKNDLATAKTQLKWVIDTSKEPAVKAVAQLRYAGVLLDEKHYDAAIAELEREHAASFDALFLDLKGDIYQAKGDAKAAREAYKTALAKLIGDSPNRQLIQTKLDALGA